MDKGDLYLDTTNSKYKDSVWKISRISGNHVDLVHVSGETGGMKNWCATIKEIDNCTKPLKKCLSCHSAKIRLISPTDYAEDFLCWSCKNG